MGKVTIKDVAKEAGVSIGTVSNALNGVNVLNPDTKKRIMDAVEKLHYIPNLNGRYLKASSCKMLGFFTNSIAGPYFCTLLDAMCRQCERRGYGMNIFVTRDADVILGNIMGRQIDGAFIFEDIFVGEQEIQGFKKGDIKVVFLDREVADTSMSSVIFDSFVSSFDATRHLINLGHKRIGFIESVDELLDSRQRKAGWRAALKTYGIDSETQVLLKGAFEEEYTYNAVKTFMRYQSSKLPEAFLAGNDLSAIGCIRALQAEGYRVPEDVSVAGFDDIDISQYFTPGLTTIRNPIARQGVQAVNKLVDMIEEKTEGEIIRLKGELIVRDSCTMKK